MDHVNLEQLQRGDETAFRQLVEATNARIHALALRLTGDEAMAGEVMQEAYLQAWRALPGFRGESTLITWLHGIVVRMARRQWRGELRRRKREAGYAAGVQPHTTAAADGGLIDLEAALRALPPRMRTAVVLSCVEGYSMAETARMMGTAIGTVKAQVHRGRQLLRERLDR